MERFDFGGLAVGEMREGPACVRSLTQKDTKAGKPYLILELGNATGVATLRVWSEQISAWTGVEAGTGVYIVARVKEGWNGGPPELAISEVRALPASHPIRGEMNPVGIYTRAELESWVASFEMRLRRPQAVELFRLMRQVAGDDFLTCPAASFNHHAYIGGLAHHSCEVAEAALALATSFPEVRCAVDMDAILVGAVWHDVGKLSEYEYHGVRIRIGHSGRLATHLCVGSEMVREAVADTLAIELGLVSRHDVDHLCHVIQSHHGEWGPVKPATLEAAIIHHADLASARLGARITDLGSVEADAEFWVHPPGYKRQPIWNLRAALSAEAEANTAEAPTSLTDTANDSGNAQTATEGGEHV